MKTNVLWESQERVSYEILEQKGVEVFGVDLMTKLERKGVEFLG